MSGPSRVSNQRRSARERITEEVQVLNADLAERGIGGSPFAIQRPELRRVVGLAMMPPRIALRTLSPVASFSRIEPSRRPSVPSPGRRLSPSAAHFSAALKGNAIGASTKRL